MTQPAPVTILTSCPWTKCSEHHARNLAPGPRARPTETGPPPPFNLRSRIPEQQRTQTASTTPTPPPFSNLRSRIPEQQRAQTLVVMLVLWPVLPCYAHSAHTSIKRIMTSTFHNGFFAADADALLSNSNNYFARSTTLSLNVAALANYLATEATSADSLLRQVAYSTTQDKYESIMRNNARLRAGLRMPAIREV